MKKALSLALALALAVTALAGCSGKSGGAAKTPEELTKLYADAITANGGEAVEYNPVVTEVKEGDDSALLLEVEHQVSRLLARDTRRGARVLRSLKTCRENAVFRPNAGLTLGWLQTQLF